MLLLIAIGINRLTENGPTSFKLSARPDTKTSVQKNMKKTIPVKYGILNF